MNNTIGKQILKFRKAKNASQTELASFLGIQSQTVSKWEREICLPDITKLPQIAAFFGITIDELFGTNKHNTYENALNETDALISLKRWKEAAKKAYSSASEFPSQKIFIQRLLSALSQALLCKEKFSQKFISEAVILGKRAMQDIVDSNIKNNINYHLCAVLYQTGRTEEGDFYSEMLPTAEMCRETLGHFKYSGKELHDFSSKKISLYNALIANSFWDIASDEANSCEQNSIEYMEKALFHYNEAFNLSDNRQYLQTVILAKISIAKAYFNISEKNTAKQILEEAEIFACKHSAQELYYEYLGKYWN